MKQTCLIDKNLEKVLKISREEIQNSSGEIAAENNELVPTRRSLPESDRPETNPERKRFHQVWEYTGSWKQIQSNLESTSWLTTMERTWFRTNATILGSGVQIIKITSVTLKLRTQKKSKPRYSRKNTSIGPSMLAEGWKKPTMFCSPSGGTSRERLNPTLCWACTNH